METVLKTIICVNMGIWTFEQFGKSMHHVCKVGIWNFEHLETDKFETTNLEIWNLKMFFNLEIVNWIFIYFET